MLICIILECLGLHIKMDKLLFHSFNWRSFLSSLLQLFIYKLVVAITSEDCTAIFQLRRHPNELSCIACYKKGSNQSNTTQRLQGPRNWSFTME